MGRKERSRHDKENHQVSIATEARAAQRKELLDSGASPELVEATDKVYDGLDRLNATQKSLIVQTALSEAHQALVSIVQGEHSGGAMGMLLYVNALVAVAGYANQSLREEREETTTGDAAVTEVIRELRHLVALGAKEGLSDKGRDLLDTLSKRVQARVNTNGEDFDAVYADEAVKLAKELADSGADPADYGFATSAPTAAAEPDTGYGMYL